VRYGTPTRKNTLKNKRNRVLSASLSGYPHQPENRSSTSLKNAEGKKTMDDMVKSLPFLILGLSLIVLGAMDGAGW